MKIELCDLCEKKEPNRRFKIKMSKKGYYQDTGYGIWWCDLWQPYKKYAFVRIAQKSCLVLNPVQLWH